MKIIVDEFSCSLVRGEDIDPLLHSLFTPRPETKAFGEGVAASLLIPRADACMALAAQV